MRKITLFTLAAVTASVAVAANPQVKHELSLQKAEITAHNAVAVAQVKMNEVSEGIPENAVPSQTPLYASKNNFWLGLGQDLSGYNKPFGFTGSKGNLYFVNTCSNPTAQTWYLDEFLGYQGEGADRQEVINSITSTETDLVVKLNPFNSMLNPTQFISAPTIVADTLGGTFQYNDSTIGYCVGRSAYWWGFPGEEGFEDPENPKITELMGMSGTIATGRSWFTGTEIGKKIGGGNDFNQNGVSNAWYEEFDCDANAVKIQGFGSIIPEQSSPFLLSGVYPWLNAKTTEATPLEATVYGFDEEGKLDTDIVLGKGTAILPKGDFSGTLLFEIHSVILDLETSNPAAIPASGAFVAITGFEAETVTSFNPIINGNQLCKESNFREKVWRTFYPFHSYLVFNYPDTEGNEIVEYLSIPYLYGVNGGAADDLCFAREFAINYIVDFPVVIDAENGSSDFTFDAPVEGGEKTFFVSASYDIDQLITDEEITHSATADWFTYEIGYDEENEVSTVTIVADAMPEGVEGRTGTIDFTGYACDFSITVKQGEVGDDEGSIGEINAAANGAAEYFDLQGRRLMSAPAKGVYIQRNGATATKLIR